MKYLALILLLLPLGVHAEQILAGGLSQNMSTSVTNFPMIGARGTTNTSDNVTFGVTPVGGTLRNLNVNFGTAPGAGTSRICTVRVNGIVSTLGCTVADTATTCSDKTNSVYFPEQSFLSMQCSLTGTPAATRMGFTLTADTNDGSMMILGRVSNPSQTLTEYGLVNDGNNLGFQTLEASSTIAWPDTGTLDSFYQKTPGAPGVGKNYLYAIRQNYATSSLQMTLADTATQSKDVTHNLSITQGDQISIVAHPTGTPGAGNSGFGLRFRSSTGKTSIFIANEGGFETASAATRALQLNGNGVDVAAGSEDGIKITMPVPFVFTNLMASDTPPGVGFTRTFALRINGSNSSTATCTMTDTQNTCSWSGAVSVATGATVSIADTASSASAALGQPVVVSAGYTPHTFFDILKTLILNKTLIVY